MCCGYTGTIYTVYAHSGIIDLRNQLKSQYEEVFLYNYFPTF